MLNYKNMVYIISFLFESYLYLCIHHYYVRKYLY